MKGTWFVLLVLFLGNACTPPAGIPTAAAPTATAARPACDEAGTVNDVRIEKALRGYSYSFKIYLPPCYEAAPADAYPVLYMVPGRSSGPETWIAAGATDIAGRLIQSGRLPPLIIVFTENIDNDPEAEEISQEIIPYVEAHYRTLTDRRHRAAGGGSLGGIAAYRLVFREPERFASAGMFGSGAISGEEPRIRDWLAAVSAEAPIRVFFDCGDGDPFMLDRARVMAGMLDEAGIPYEFHVEPGGVHAYSTWALRLEAYYLWVAQDW